MFLEYVPFHGNYQFLHRGMLRRSCVSRSLAHHARDHVIGQCPITSRGSANGWLRRKRSCGLNRVNCLHTEVLMQLYKSATLLVVLLAGCLPTVTATPDGQRVKLMKADPPADCEEIRDVQGSDTAFVESGVNRQSAKAKLRNAAASLGANYVRMESEEKDGTTLRLYGTAYRCPTVPKTAAAR